MDAFNAKIGKAAEEAHLDGFEWMTDGKVGATWLAHRLLWYALQKDEQEQEQASQAQSSNNGTAKHSPGIQEKLAARLYLAFHKENEDLSNIDTLSKLSTEVGLFQDKSKVRQWLESDDGDYEVGHAVDMGLRNGVQSVPFLVLQVCLPFPLFNDVACKRQKTKRLFPPFFPSNFLRTAQIIPRKWSIIQI